MCLCRKQTSLFLLISQGWSNYGFTFVNSVHLGEWLETVAFKSKCIREIQKYDLKDLIDLYD